jgi:hypothetical protein
VFVPAQTMLYFMQIEKYSRKDAKDAKECGDREVSVKVHIFGSVA